MTKHDTSLPFTRRPIASRRYRVASLVLFCALFAPGVFACDGGGPTSTPSAGQPAPALVGVNIDGSPVDLASFGGRIILVDFWASWCEPCKEAMPELDALAVEYADDLVIIGVSVDEDAAAMHDFAEGVGVHFLLVHDVEHDIAASWSPPKMPTTFVIAPDGAVFSVHGGFAASTGAALRADIELLRARRAPREPGATS